MSVGMKHCRGYVNRMTNAKANLTRTGSLMRRKKQNAILIKKRRYLRIKLTPDD